VFVIRPAGSEAKPVANHENTHPKVSLVMSALQPALRHVTPAEPASKLTPPGQIGGQASPVDD